MSYIQKDAAAGECQAGGIKLLTSTLQTEL